VARKSVRWEVRRRSHPRAISSTVKWQLCLILRQFGEGKDVASLTIYKLLEMPAPRAVEAIRAGLPMAEFDAVAETFRITTDRLATLLGISPRTLRHHRKQDAVLSRDHSEKLLRMGRIRSVGRKLFTTDRALVEWLDSSAPSLSGRTPFEMLDTELGAREVESVLQGLVHGNVM